MKLLLLILLFFVFNLNSQIKSKPPITPINKDNVQAIYDSLDKLYYYNKIELETTSKYNFKPNEIPVYTPEVYQERISNLAQKSPFNYRYNKVVQNYITMYSKRIKSTGTLLALSELYFPLYEKYLNQYNLPLELKYLSIVESALNPTAKSPCGAAGLWQFMYGTGKSYKLDINSYIDERFDPEKETIAACAYLSDLYKIYGQWDLAIAAYNCGPGNVNKGIKKAGGKYDFWAIYDYLPKETQGYVPAFIAASYICEFHEYHNINKAKANFLFDEIDVININFNTNLKQLAYLLNMDYKELKYLNPKYVTGNIPGGFNHAVVVPKQKALDWIDIEFSLINKTSKPKAIVSSKTNTISNNTVKNESKIIIQKDNNLSVTKKKSLFGTSYSNSNNNLENVTTPNNETKTVSDFNKTLDDSKGYLCISNGNQNLINGSILSLRLMDDINYNGKIIPKNSVFKARAEFKKQSIVFKITSAITPEGEIPLNFITEIFENTNGKFYLEDGFTLLLRI